MTVQLMCGCVTGLGSACARAATQEDLLCDQCREGAGYNGVIVYTGREGHAHIKVERLDLERVTR